MIFRGLSLERKTKTLLADMLILLLLNSRNSPYYDRQLHKLGYVILKIDVACLISS